jgi:hypothetical protein
LGVPLRPVMGIHIAYGLSSLFRLHKSLPFRGCLSSRMSEQGTRMKILKSSRLCTSLQVVAILSSCSKKGMTSTQDRLPSASVSKSGSRGPSEIVDRIPSGGNQRREYQDERGHVSHTRIQMRKELTYGHQVLVRDEHIIVIEEIVEMEGGIAGVMVYCSWV